MIIKNEISCARRQQVATLEKAVIRSDWSFKAGGGLRAQDEAMIEGFDGQYPIARNHRAGIRRQPVLHRAHRRTLGERRYRAIMTGTRFALVVNDRALGREVRWEVGSAKIDCWGDVVKTLIDDPDGTMSKMAMHQDVMPES